MKKTPVIAKDCLDNVFRFESIEDASRRCCVRADNIRHVLAGRRDTAGFRGWKFKKLERKS